MVEFDHFQVCLEPDILKADSAGISLVALRDFTTLSKLIITCLRYPNLVGSMLFGGTRGYDIATVFNIGEGEQGETRTRSPPVRKKARKMTLKSYLTTSTALMSFVVGGRQCS